MKNILVLGAGLVSKPLVHYLLQNEFGVKVASRTVSKAEALVEGFKNGSAETLNVKDEERLEELIAESALVISLLPYTFHVTVAKLCLKHQKHLVTTSYVSPEMKALDEEAKAAGLLFLNEIGLDPGIDHMSAMKIIHEVEHKHGKVVSFRSYCGGLPALQSNTNPFGYKFSWSPRSVVMAGKNNGQYLQDGEIVFIPGRDLFKHYEIIHVEGAGEFEAYTNRNALPYQKLYGLKDAHTVFRGTFRNIGWCYTMEKARRLGLFDDSPREDLKDLTYRDMMVKLIDQKKSEDIVADTAKFLNVEKHATLIKRLEWLGLFEDEPLPDEDNVMDMFASLLQKKISMQKEDLDLIIIYHRFTADYGSKKEFISSTFVQTGIPGGESAMSRAVSLPAAIATRMILQGEIDLSGVHIPVVPEVYVPVLQELETMGIKFSEKTELIS